MEIGQQNNQQTIDEVGVDEENNEETSELRHSEMETIAPAKGVA